MFDIEYKPNILQADAADSITRGFEKVFESSYRRLMCWFHMRKAVEKNLSNFSKNKKQQNEFMYDIDRLQLSQSDEGNTFDQFKTNNFACNNVTFPNPFTEQNWLEGKCSCRDYFKHFICQHIVGVSLRMKYVVAPDEAKNIPLGQKRKRGRVALAKAALVLQ